MCLKSISIQQQNSPVHPALFCLCPGFSLSELAVILLLFQNLLLHKYITAGTGAHQAFWSLGGRPFGIKHYYLLGHSLGH